MAAPSPLPRREPLAHFSLASLRRLSCRPPLPDPPSLACHRCELRRTSLPDLTGLPDPPSLARHLCELRRTSPPDLPGSPDLHRSLDLRRLQSPRFAQRRLRAPAGIAAPPARR